MDAAPCFTFLLDLGVVLEINRNTTGAKSERVVHNWIIVNMDAGFTQKRLGIEN